MFSIPFLYLNFHQHTADDTMGHAFFLFLTTFCTCIFLLSHYLFTFYTPWTACTPTTSLHIHTGLHTHTVHTVYRPLCLTSCPLWMQFTHTPLRCFAFIYLYTPAYTRLHWHRTHHSLVLLPATPPTVQCHTLHTLFGLHVLVPTPALPTGSKRPTHTCLPRPTLACRLLGLRRWPFPVHCCLPRPHMASPFYPHQPQDYGPTSPHTYLRVPAYTDGFTHTHHTRLPLLGWHTGYTHTPTHTHLFVPQPRAWFLPRGHCTAGTSSFTSLSGFACLPASAPAHCTQCTCCTLFSLYPLFFCAACTSLRTRAHLHTATFATFAQLHWVHMQTYLLPHRCTHARAHAHVPVLTYFCTSLSLSPSL